MRINEAMRTVHDMCYDASVKTLTIDVLTNDSVLTHKRIIGSGEFSISHVGERPSRKFGRRAHLGISIR